MVVQELIAKLGFDVDQGGLNSVDNALGNFAKKLTLAAAGIYAVKKAVEATVWAISSSIGAAAQKEDVTTQFKVMLGDLEAAKYLYQEINQYAAVSPFETAGLAENVKLMMSFGMSAKDAFDDLKKLGDVALGDQNKMNHIALAYAQTKAAGRLTGNDLLQYVNAGFNPLEYIAKRTNRSADSLRQDMAKGKVSFDMVRQAFVDATSAGGKFYKGAEEGSQTWNGMLSTARDNLRMLGAELGDRMLPFLKEVLTAFWELWDGVAGAFRNMATAMSVFSEGMPEAITWATILATIFGTVADAVVLAMTTIQGFIVVFEFLANGVAGILGVIIDAILWIPKKLAAEILTAGEYILWLAKLAQKVLPKGTIKSETLAKAETTLIGLRDDLDVDNRSTFTQRAFEANRESKDLGNAWDKFIELGQMIGKTEGAPDKISLTDKIEKILAGMAGKQPVTINNQTNNLTINADDPMKAMFEPQAARFFQSAFVQLRHATT